MTSQDITSTGRSATAAKAVIDRMTRALGGRLSLESAAAEVITATGWRRHPGWGIGAPTAGELTGLRLVPHDPREAAAAQAPALDDADPVAHLASAIAALLLEAIAGGAPSDPAATAALLGAVAELPGKESRPSLPPGGPAWSAEPLTQSETRVLQFLPTYMSAREIAAELCVSANTVRTHVRHVYRKLGARNRHEAVQRACATGLLPASSCSHRH
jgi:LuxR family maltose regulon positive regulatory protein